MTRTRMTKAIKDAMIEDGIEVDEYTQKIIDATINGTLDYVLDFSQDVSRELVGFELYSEAMVAGVIVRKLKELRQKIRS